jgi:hypothetical protein
MEERVERKVNPVQNGVQTFAIEARDASIFLTQIREFGILLLARDADTARFPDVAALLEERVAGGTRCRCLESPQGRSESALLAAPWGRDELHASSARL